MVRQPETAVVYARYSTDRQDSRSIDDQVRRCRSFCAQRGLTVVEEFSDSAVSGAHVERDALRRLLDRARGGSRGAPFSAVIVDDLSRLSRDLGNTWQLVFGDLASCGVRVIDATSGQSSDSAGARVTFGALALVNDTFLQLVRAETHRGLEGRAIAGFSTGGRCYGFSSVPEENPADPAHPRRVLRVSEDQAAVVREIFQCFVAGESRSSIARRLTERGTPPPVAGKGWGRGAVNSILSNEKYKGTIRWNACEAGRRGGTGTWRKRTRPAAEHVVRELPSLAIVPVDLWAAAAERLRAQKASGHGRPAGTGRHVYIASGLLRCGACGGPMSIVSRKRSGSVEVSRFGCRGHRGAGNTRCTSRRTLTTEQATEAILDALGELASPERLAPLLPSASAPFDAEPGETVSSLEEAEKRVANLTDALARLGWSDAVASSLQAEERKLRELRAVARRAPEDAHVDPEILAAFLLKLVAWLRDNPEEGRLVLHAFTSKVSVSHTAEEARLTGAFDVAALAEACRRRAGKSMHAFSCSP